MLPYLHCLIEFFIRCFACRRWIMIEVD